MQVEISRQEKKSISPFFFIIGEEDRFIFVLKNTSHENRQEIKNSLNNSNATINFNMRNDLILDTGKNEYYFVLESYQELFNHHKLYIGFDFAENENQIGDFRRILVIEREQKEFSVL